MLLVSTRLGLIACGYLSDAYYQNKWVSAPQMAERYNMNVRILMQALRGLTRAGILQSRVGGNNPGFMFSKDPKEYSVIQIIDALEVRREFKCCKDVIAGLKCDCDDKSACVIYNLFDKVTRDAANKMAAVPIVNHSANCSPPEEEQ